MAAYAQCWRSSLHPSQGGRISGGIGEFQGARALRHSTMATTHSRTAASRGRPIELFGLMTFEGTWGLFGAPTL